MELPCRVVMLPLNTHLFSVYSSCHVGEVPLSVHESAVELLLLAYKFIAMVRTASEAMRSILVRHLYPELEGVKQDDVQELSKVCTCK